MAQKQQQGIGVYVNIFIFVRAGRNGSLSFVQTPLQIMLFQSGMYIRLDMSAQGEGRYRKRGVTPSEARSRIKSAMNEVEREEPPNPTEPYRDESCWCQPLDSAGTEHTPSRSSVSETHAEALRAARNSVSSRFPSKNADKNTSSAHLQERRMRDRCAHSRFFPDVVRNYLLR